ncbi:MAG: LacI family DNA-binding transcriptional regulator [Acidobacteriota bacterium]|nr:LacI family DNA-binding transcriptional regulator [Acidobacteriota bacterium]
MHSPQSFTRRNPKQKPAPGRPASLKSLARALGLSPATVSFVLNKSPVADSIPEETKERVFAAAKKFNYKPNFVARSLRAQRSYIIGVVVPEVSEGYVGLVLSGIEDYLVQEGYFYFVVSHRHKPDLIREGPELLAQRSVEGIIAVDTPCEAAHHLPVVAISGHTEREGVTNIVLDHERAAMLALGHLHDLGHRNIAMIKGQSFSSDTEIRWQALRGEAGRLGLSMHPRLTAALEGDKPSPHAGYAAARKLLAAQMPFSAVVAFNDVSAIGAIRAIHEAGLAVPGDVSVVGFDDIPSAAYQNPALTTVRQPLREMGKVAARTVLARISNGIQSAYPGTLTVDPSLVVRESTAKAR